MVSFPTSPSFSIPNFNHLRQTNMSLYKVDNAIIPVIQTS